MTFQDTRLYELCLWMFGCLAGAALALLCLFLLFPLYDRPSTVLVYTVSDEPEMSSRAQELRSMSEINDHQLDELILLDKQLKERVQVYYQKRMEARQMYEYIGFSVLALLGSILIFVSIRLASPMITLVLAAWSVSLSMLAIYVTG